MSNIAKELEASKEKQLRQVDTDSVINEVKLLMDAQSQEDLRIFRGLGNSHSIAVSETELGKKMELERLDGKYAGNVFTAEQIKLLAVKYNLRFLRSNLYKGKMDVQVASAIRSFAKETNTEITTASLNYNFFILAPERSFRLRKETRRKFWESKDPAIFYKIDDRHYRLIHKWGTDFTIGNRIKGLQNQSFKSALITNFLIFFTFAALAACFLIKMKVPYVANNLFLVPVVSFLVAYFCQAGRLESPINQDDLCYSPEKWNSDTKLS
jgi:hypothetical protein